MSRPPKPPAGVDFALVCDRARELPGVELSTSYGTPALKVKGKLIVRLKEDGETIVLRTDPAARDRLLAAEPAIFHLTDHYRNAPYVLVHLAALRPDQLPDLLEHAWLEVAPPSLIRQPRA